MCPIVRVYIVLYCGRLSQMAHDKTNGSNLCIIRISEGKLNISHGYYLSNIYLEI